MSLPIGLAPTIIAAMARGALWAEGEATHKIQELEAAKAELEARVFALEEEKARLENASERNWRLVAGELLGTPGGTPAAMTVEEAVALARRLKAESERLMVELDGAVEAAGAPCGVCAAFGRGGAKRASVLRALDEAE